MFDGYHIIVVPQDATKSRRLQISSLTARLVALGGLLIVPLLVGAIFSTIHYQNKVVALKMQMQEEHQIVEQKEILASRIVTLERSLSRTQQSVDDLKGALDMETRQIQAGVGPIEGMQDQEHPLQTLPKPVPSLSMDEFLEGGGQVSVQNVHKKLHDLDERINGLNTDIEGIYSINEDKIKFLNAMPNLMPVDGWITSGFGYRVNPYSGIYKMHMGLDIASPIGTIVRAPADGKVILTDFSGGYGRKVVIEHGFGVETVYAHGSQFFVKEGDVVKRGAPVAAVGSTGSSTGPHLHYEVHVDGIPTDPLQYVFK